MKRVRRRRGGVGVGIRDVGVCGRKVFHRRRPGDLRDDEKYHCRDGEAYTEPRSQRELNYEPWRSPPCFLSPESTVVV